jgi:hypothetical protein
MKIQLDKPQGAPPVLIKLPDKKSALKTGQKQSPESEESSSKKSVSF